MKGGPTRIHTFERLAPASRKNTGYVVLTANQVSRFLKLFKNGTYITGAPQHVVGVSCPKKLAPFEAAYTCRTAPSVSLAIQERMCILVAPKT